MAAVQYSKASTAVVTDFSALGGALTPQAGGGAASPLDALKAAAMQQIVKFQLSFNISRDRWERAGSSPEKGIKMVQELTLFSWYGIYNRRAKKRIELSLSAFASVKSSLTYETGPKHSYRLISSEPEQKSTHYSDAVVAYVAAWAKEREQVNPQDWDFKQVPGLSEAEAHWQRETVKTGKFGPFADLTLEPCRPLKQLSRELKEIIPYFASALQVALCFARILAEKEGSAPVNFGKIYGGLRAEGYPQIKANGAIGLVGYHAVLTPWGVMPLDTHLSGAVASDSDTEGFVILPDERIEIAVRERFASSVPIEYGELEVRSLGRLIDGHPLPPIQFVAAEDRLAQEASDRRWKEIRDHVFMRISRS